MKLRMSAQGMNNTSETIRNIFSMLAEAPYLREREAMESALKSAQAYEANMQGNKHGIQAQHDQYSLEQRKGIDDYLAANPDLPEYQKRLALGHKWMGGNDIEKFAKAATEFQSQGFREQAENNLNDLDRVNRLNTLAEKGATYTPYDNIGNTGFALNKATGAAVESSPALSRWHGTKNSSEIDENHATAASARSLAEERRARTSQITNGSKAPRKTTNKAFR
jgi:hypothetical protein